MQATLKREKIVPLEKSTYMEVVGNNRITYRVTKSRIVQRGEEYTAYGIEAETGIGPIKFKESIDDFSRELGTAVSFAEMLVDNNIKPSLIYNAALCFLRENI